ncbi:MAG: PIN domain-containing protein [Burkholderiaceae bacterium]
MAALDANILVRFLVEDDSAQLATVRRLIRRVVAAGDTLFIPVTVVVELEWVLRSNFGFAKVEVLRTMSQLLSSTELTFESEGAVEVAVMQYQKGAADFSDCLHAALATAAGQLPLWTFDRAAAKVTGARLLST